MSVEVLKSSHHLEPSFPVDHVNGFQLQPLFENFSSEWKCGGGHESLPKIRKEGDCDEAWRHSLAPRTTQEIGKELVCTSRGDSCQRIQSKALPSHVEALGFLRHLPGIRWTANGYRTWVPGPHGWNAVFCCSPWARPKHVYIPRTWTACTSRRRYPVSQSWPQWLLV